MNTAIYKRSIPGWQGDARLYQLLPPLEHTEWGSDAPVLYDHVIVSAVVAMFSGPETYIFPATEDGEVIDFGELEGSYRGGMDHAIALGDAGYEIVTPIEGTLAPKQIEG